MNANSTDKCAFAPLLTSGNRPCLNCKAPVATKNKTIMGLMHKNYNIHGFQFHPESISTKVGMKLIKNFITN